jgi:hypothetical protein
VVGGEVAAKPVTFTAPVAVTAPDKPLQACVVEVGEVVAACAMPAPGSVRSAAARTNLVLMSDHSPLN